MGGRDIFVISSEKTSAIEIFKNGLESGIKVVFDVNGVSSQAEIFLEPELSCRWWTLRTV